MVGNKLETLKEFKQKVDKIETTTDISEKKQSIPKVLRKQTWSLYIGIENGKSKCFCCRIEDITVFDFHCGHVISEKKGGALTTENLRPICKSCNLSMGTKCMFDFINEHKLWGKPLKNINYSSDEDDNIIKKQKAGVKKQKKDIEWEYPLMTVKKLKKLCKDRNLNVSNSLSEDDYICILTLNDMTVSELKEICKTDKVSIKSNFTKNDYIEAIMNADNITYENMTITELKKICNTNGLKIKNFYKKNDIVNLLNYSSYTIPELEEICDDKGLTTKSKFLKINYINSLILNDLTITELKKICNNENIKFTSSMKKCDYIKLLCII